MRINQVQNYQYNNYCIQNRKPAPSFTGTQAPSSDGLYRNEPEKSVKIINALGANPNWIKFCKKYNAGVGYHAVQKGNTLYESSLHILYNDPTLSKIEAYFAKIFGIKKEIVIYGYGSTLEESTEKLVNCILPEGFEGRGKGILDSHIEMHDNEIQKKLDKKNAKIAAQKAEKQAKIDAKEKQNEDKQALNDAIKKYTGE